MRPSFNVRRAGGWVVCIALAACARVDAPRHDSGAVVRIPLDTIESFGALATRREAQGSFDAARAALVRKNYKEAATALSDAAGFIRAEAGISDVETRKALDRAGDELDSLAGRVARAEVRSAATLDRVVARAHGAEASLHLLNAHAAMVKRDHVRAGEELMMSIDHLERAAKDARLPTDSVLQAAIADTRSLANEMVRGMEAVPDEAARLTDEIEAAIRRIDSATKRATPAPSPVKPSPCPMAMPESTTKMACPMAEHRQSPNKPGGHSQCAGMRPH